MCDSRDDKMCIFQCVLQHFTGTFSACLVRFVIVFIFAARLDKKYFRLNPNKNI